MSHIFEEVEVDITDETFLKIAKQAHDRNITFNEMCEIMLNDYINELEKDK